MNLTILAGVMAIGLLLSISSVYLNKLVFADDQWSDIAQRQQQQESRAAMVYGDKYQFNNIATSARDYLGLSYVTTDSSTKGRDLAGQAQMSIENAMATFDKEHVMQLTGTWGTGYPDLTSISTDEKARDRNAIIANAIDERDKQVANLVSQLAQIAQSYTSMPQAISTDEKAYDRQAQILKNSNAQEAQAAALLNQIWQIDQSYVNLVPAGSTNENTVGRQLTLQEANALKNGITIFEEIHAKNLASTYATGYDGLTSTSTNEQITGPGVHASPDRTTEINTATEMALQNAINFYNAYYPNTPLNQPSYSH